MDDSDILARIREMVDAEHQLRREMQEDPDQVTDATQQLHALEEALDQCWICCVSGAPIGSLPKIPMNRGRDPGNRWRGTCSKTYGRYAATVHARCPDVIKRDSTRLSRFASAPSSRRDDQVLA